MSGAPRGSIDLISKLGEEEGEAEANGLDSSGRLETLSLIHI